MEVDPVECMPCIRLYLTDEMIRPYDLNGSIQARIVSADRSGKVWQQWMEPAQYDGAGTISLDQDLVGVAMDGEVHG